MKPVKRSVYMNEDQKWMDQLTKGQLDGFNHLYQKYAGPIYVFFKSRIKDLDLVHDLHQITWEKVYKKAHLFNIEQKFSSWLFTIASNVLIDEIRKKTRLQKFKDDILSGDMDMISVLSENSNDLQADQITNQHSTGHTSDFDELLTNKINDQLSDRLNTLSALNKKIIEMRYLEEKSFLEISKVLNLKEPNVRKIVSRVLKKLKGSDL